jgi:SAM-dependent methyltransferase
MSVAIRGKDTQVSNLNIRRWESGNYVASFAHRVLRPAEVVILARYREAMSGRVLEIGSGAGRILGYLLELGAEAYGIDVSVRMVEYCRQRYPGATVMVGDMANLPAGLEGPFDVILGSYNVIDVMDDSARRQLLADLRDRLAPAGLLIFSSHNRAYAEARPAASKPRRLLSKLDRPVSELASFPWRLPERVRNRRRLAPLERRTAEYAILNDEALDYGLLHYYIRRDDQSRQLEQLGYELVECLDLEGRSVPAGETAAHCPELHYVARRR